MRPWNPDPAVLIQFSVGTLSLAGKDKKFKCTCLKCIQCKEVERLKSHRFQMNMSLIPTFSFKACPGRSRHTVYTISSFPLLLQKSVLVKCLPFPVLSSSHKSLKIFFHSPAIYGKSNFAFLAIKYFKYWPVLFFCFFHRGNVKLLNHSLCV